ncbi:hypothetical protein ACFP2T_06460 [Plantactinospora solaniradicis]|uniref:Uncharacterized protein n=1 Tax=Plantactinospora solaniradicis TaxID=1723736 RepID=A0ABW1K256_9ACTN
MTSGIPARPLLGLADPVSAATLSMIHVGKRKMAARWTDSVGP